MNEIEHLTYNLTAYNTDTEEDVDATDLENMNYSDNLQEPKLQNIMESVNDIDNDNLDRNLLTYNVNGVVVDIKDLKNKNYFENLHEPEAQIIVDIINKGDDGLTYNLLCEENLEELVDSMDLDNNDYSENSKEDKPKIIVEIDNKDDNDDLNYDLLACNENEDSVDSMDFENNYFENLNELKPQKIVEIGNNGFNLIENNDINVSTKEGNIKEEVNLEEENVKFKSASSVEIGIQCDILKEVKDAAVQTDCSYVLDWCEKNSICFKKVTESDANLYVNIEISDNLNNPTENRPRKTIRLGLPKKRKCQNK